MNSKSDADESDTDSKDIINRAVPPSNPVAKQIPGRPVARLYCKNKFEYLIQKTRVLVGRSGGDIRPISPDVDVSIDSCSLYISRRHFDIFTNDCIKFYVSVYSKNGLFVNGLFLRRGSAAYQLKNQSRLRFPKTDLKIIFQVFEKDSDKLLDNSINNNNVTNDSFNTTNTQDSENSQNNSLTNFNNLLSPHQQMQGQQTNPSLSNNMDPQSNFPLTIVSSQSKLEREVYKQQQSNLQAGKKRKLNESSNELTSPQITPSTNTNTLVLPQDWRGRGDFSDGRKPPFSYSQLIAQAIFSTSEQMLCLNDIYLFITKTYPFYRPEEKGWQNSIRHNLSLSKSFVRMPRANDEGKGSLWTIQPSDKENMMKTAYRPRGARDKYSSVTNHHSGLNPVNHHHLSNLSLSSHMGKIPSMGDSEDSSDMYPNEDEEAVNSLGISSSSHPQPPESSLFSYSSGGLMHHQGSEAYAEGDGEHILKSSQQQQSAAILQSSFANPMQIFMQPDKRTNNNKNNINIIHNNNLSQVTPLQQINNNSNNSSLPKNNLPGSGSVQVVRLTLNDNNNNVNQEAWRQQQYLLQQQQQQQQQQQIRIQQMGQNNSGQRIIILRPAQQQQSDSSLSITNNNTPSLTTISQNKSDKNIIDTNNNNNNDNNFNNNNNNNDSQQISEDKSTNEQTESTLKTQNQQQQQTHETLATTESKSSPHKSNNNNNNNNINENITNNNNNDHNNNNTNNNDNNSNNNNGEAKS